MSEENTTQEELDSMIASSMAKYFKAEKAKELKAKEEQEAMDVTFKAAVDEATKTVKAEQEKEYNEKLVTFSKEHNIVIDDTGGEANKSDESFNAQNNLSEKDAFAIKESKEFSQFYCSKLLIEEGYDVKRNSFAGLPYEKMMGQYEKHGLESFMATAADENCDDIVDDWQVEDCFVDNIWFAVICKSDLLGRVGHRVYAHNDGCGGQVQVKQISIPLPANDWGQAGTLSPCECISCVSNAFTTHTVTIKKYGDYRIICNADEILAGKYQSVVMQSMAIRLAERIDQEIMTNLTAATHTYTAALGISCGDATRATNCCEWTIDLWDAIISLEADMRAGGYFADSEPTLLIHPDVAQYLKFRNGMPIPPWMIGSIQMDGTTLTKIGNIKVVETCHMIACNTDGITDLDMALLIDPSRAFAEVWAQKPKYETNRRIECDATRMVVWAYGGFDVLDDAAIGAIQNP